MMEEYAKKRQDSEKFIPLRQEGKQHYFEVTLKDYIDVLAKDAPTKTFYEEKAGKLLGIFNVGEYTYEYFLIKEDGRPEVVKKTSWAGGSGYKTILLYNNIKKEFVPTEHADYESIDNYFSKKEKLLNQTKEVGNDAGFLERQFTFEGFAIAALENNDVKTAARAYKIAGIEKLDRVTQRLWKFKKKSDNPVDVAEFLIKQGFNI